ncbi:MAG: hypothetical protein CR968_03805 [Flavobacteriia bacterium]|nr:MAG: hypothetical protein CR968_03805 [Flavobacteriia bacterium]
MKKIYIFLMLFLVSLTVFSQNKKFSVEVNYPLAFSEFVKFTGIVDAGLKYQFTTNESINYGASFTFDYLKADRDRDFVRDYLFFHVNGFSETIIPSLNKIHVFFGAGFTYVTHDSISFFHTDDYTDVIKDKENDSGFNLKFGAQYDLSSRFFVQSYYHFIRTYDKSRISDNIFKIHYNQVKLGVGVRF